MQRVDWSTGQGLLADDLDAAAAYDTRQRQLHASVVHDAWGVVLGLAVARSEAVGEVLVSAGFAYDRLGREIVVDEVTTLDAPAHDGTADSRWLDLALRWTDEEDLAARRDPWGSCGRGASGWLERPTWRWVPAGTVRRDADGHPLPFVGYGPGFRLGIDVPLARFEQDTKGGLHGPDLSRRRVAHGLVRPHVAGGTVRQSTIGIQGTPLEWSGWVDTSAAGFTTGATRYFVTLDAHPWGPTSTLSVPGQAAGVDVSALLPRALGPFVEVTESQRDGFAVVVRTMVPSTGAAIVGPVGHHPEPMKVTTNPVPLTWVGIEWVGGCEPIQEVPVR